MNGKGCTLSTRRDAPLPPNWLLKRCHGKGKRAFLPSYLHSRLSQYSLSHFEFQHPLMAPCRTLVVPWCVGMSLRLRIGLGVRRTWRKLEKTCSTFKLQCRKEDTIQDLWELELFISCAFLGIRIPSSMWEQRCGNRQGSKAAVYSRYNKN